MLTFFNGAQTPTRRDFFRIGALGRGGLTLPDLLRLRAQSATTERVRQKSVIFVYLFGGPSHVDTYDMKPDAPAEYRGEFKPIRTKVPGLDVCELLPQHARIADKFTIIRSVAHTFADHGGGHKKFLTGRDPQQPDGFVNDYPMVGSMVAKMRDGVKRGVPNYIAGTDPGRDGIDVFSFGSAYLGPATHPFTVSGDPSSPAFVVRNMATTQENVATLREKTD